MPWQLCIILLILLSFACGGSQKNQSSPPTLPPQKLNLKPTDPNEKIVFLTLSVALADSVNDTYNFTIKNTLFADGVLKGSRIQEEPVIERNYLYCQLSNKQGETGSWIKVPDPLNTVYEHPGEGSNDLGKTIFKNKKGEVTIRFQWNSKLNYLTIYKPATNVLTLKKIYYAEF